jgi:hypothetical protein
MAFLDIVKKERTDGSGIISSLTSSAAKTTLEKMDPRNYLFRSGGILNALFPKIKGYRSTPSKTDKTSPLSSLGGIDSAVTLVKLDEINRNTSISAKNSVVLPKMAMDINIMKLNIMKLVSAAGKPVSRSPDMFFATAKKREEMYESQFGKRTTTPTPAETKEKRGFLQSILDFFSGGLLNMLIKGGLITSALILLGKYFESEEFRTSVNTIVDKVVTSIFGADAWQNLTTGILTAVAAFASYKFVLEAAKTGLIGLELGLLKAVGALGVGGLLGAIAPILGLGAYALWLMKNDKRELMVPDEFGNVQGGMTPDMSSVISQSGGTTEDIVKGRGLAQVLDEKEMFEKLQKETDYENQKLLKRVPATTSSTSPTPVPSQNQSDKPVTFNSLSLQEQNALLDQQFKNEGGKPGNLNYDLNNPGAMLYSSWMTKYGAVKDPNRGSGDLKGKFAKFPTYEQGREAQRELWSRDYGNLPLDQAINRWTTGKLKGDGSSEIENYKNSLFTSINKDPPTQMAGTPKTPGSTIAMGSSAMNDAVRSFNVPTVTVNAPQTTNVQQGGSTGMSGGLPSVVDQDFMKYLVGRAT